MHTLPATQSSPLQCIVAHLSLCDAMSLARTSRRYNAYVHAPHIRRLVLGAERDLEMRYFVNWIQFGRDEMFLAWTADGVWDPRRYECICFRLACEYGCTEVVRALLKNTLVDPCVRGSVAVQWAARYNHVPVVALLIKDGRADINAFHCNALMYACERGSVELVELLLSCTSAGEGVGTQCITEAAAANNVAVLRMLLRRFDPTHMSSVALDVVGAKSYAEVLAVLLEDGRVDPTYRNNALFRNVVQRGNTTLARMLLQDARIADTLNDAEELTADAEELGRTTLAELLRDHCLARPFKRLKGNL